MCNRGVFRYYGGCNPAKIAVFWLVLGRMGYAITHFWPHFWPYFDPNTIFWGSKRTFWILLDHRLNGCQWAQKNASLQGRLRGVSRRFQGRFRYNYTASFCWRQQDVAQRLILRACTHYARGCGVLYYRSKQARSMGRSGQLLMAALLNVSDPLFDHVPTDANLMPNKCKVNAQ